MNPPISQKSAVLVWESRTGTARTLCRRAAILLERRGWTVRSVPARTADPQVLRNADLVVFGTYCAANRPARETRKLWSLPLVLNRTAAFVTHASDEAGPRYEAWAAGPQSEFEAFASRCAGVSAGYFHCRGRASPLLRLFVRAGLFRGTREGALWNRSHREHPGMDALERFDGFVEGLA